MPTIGQRAFCAAAITIGLGGAAFAQGASPAGAVPMRAAAPDEMRALLDAARETAKATRESVDYGRVVPDILTQILAKLDKIEDKLDRLDSTQRAASKRR